MSEDEIDFQPAPDDGIDFQTEPQWSDLPKNIIPDAKNMLKGNADLALRTARGINDLPGDLAGTAIDLVHGKSPSETPLGQDANTVGSGLINAAKAIPKSFTDLGNKKAWIEHPVGNALTAGSIVAPFLGGEAAAEDLAAGAAKGIKPPAAIKGSGFIPREIIKPDAPLGTVYHGSNSNFDTFSMAKSKGETAGLGHFFTPSIDEAGMYGKNVRPYQIDMKNPWKVTGQELNQAIETEGPENLRNRLAQEGYDGITMTQKPIHHIVFDASKIKPISEPIKDLPVIDPGAETGAPHALFAYNDKMAPGGAERSIYNVYGDKAHPAIKARGWGSSVPESDLKKAGIPITGREPKSVGKFEPIVDNPGSVTPPTKNLIGQRMASRTMAQALDINPLTLRKQAMKEGVTPEDYVLQLGNKANELIPHLVEPLDTANTKFGKVLDAHDEAGSKIGQIVKSVTKGTVGSLPEGQEAINELRAAAKDYDGVDGGDLALTKTADRLENLQKDGKLDFDRLSKYKSNIGKGFNKTEAPPGTEDIYGILSDNAQKVVDRLTVQDPSMAPELAHLKEMYTLTSRLVPAMARSASKEVAGASVGGGFVSKLLPTAIGGAIGGPMGAALGGGAKYLQETVAPDLGKNLSYMTMKSAPKMIASIKKAIPNITDAAASTLASRLISQNSQEGMSKGGVVPHDVKQWVESRGC